MTPTGGRDQITTELTRIGTGPYSALVLAEWDDDLWLASVRFEQPPRPGTIFHFLNMVWQITWTEPAGCGAVPLEM